MCHRIFPFNRPEQTRISIVDFVILVVKYCKMKGELELETREQTLPEDMVVDRARTRLTRACHVIW